MTDNEHMAWDECPDSEECELVCSFLELVDSMVRDIQHLKTETVRARYELCKALDPEHERFTAVDLLSNLDMPRYDNMAYQEYVRIYYDDGDPMSFKGFVDFMNRLAKGIDDRQY